MTLAVSLIARLLKVRAECIRREKSGQMYGETAGEGEASKQGIARSNLPNS